MFIMINNSRIHYKVQGNGPDLVLVHGWACNLKIFAKLQEHLAHHFRVYVLDLPGFGLSSEPATVYSVADYADILAQFMQQVALTTPILIGHSFGGKIIINLAARALIPLKKIVLLSSSGVRLTPNFKVWLRSRLVKMLKFLARLPILTWIFQSQLEFYRNKFASTDYKNATGVMRAILVKSVNEDITDLLPNITVPTLLLWGDQDLSAPLLAGKIMQQKIPDAKLHVFLGSGHFPFIDNYEQLVKELDKFL